MATTTNVLHAPKWPAIPFHQGEIQVQKLLGSHEHVMSYAARMVRPYMPDQHRSFFVAQPFLVAAARDQEGRMWSTFLAATPSASAMDNQPAMTSSPDPNTLIIQAQPVPGDALEGALQPGTDLGIVGIEFATKRRNRVNGRIVKTTTSGSGCDDKMLTFNVDQSFGNCPQYIKPRQWWTATSNNSYSAPNTPTPTKVHPNHLSEEQMTKIRQAETIFLGSGYRKSGGDDNDPRYGNDASHRGGPAGFVHVKDNRTLILPDFSGNNHYNTIGNLVMDNRIGIAFPEYETGAMIQVTGRAQVNFDHDVAAAFYPGAERLIEIHIDAVNYLPPASIPIRWTTNTQELQERLLVVSAKIRESEDVTSFHLRPREQEVQALWKFSPGQHLPIFLAGLDPLNKDSVLERTYSISAGPDWGEYRISVKRQGLASNFLHDYVQIGDVLRVHKPAGDFVMDFSPNNNDNSRPIVLLSNGIGITPVIAMLHHWAQTFVQHKAARQVYWIHGARNSQYHAFVGEFSEVESILGPNAPLKTHIAYSQPLEGDEYNSQGRLSPQDLSKVVPNISSADIYMCGSDGFIADMEEGLSLMGVPPAQIHYETF